MQTGPRNYSIVHLEEKDVPELAALEAAVFTSAWTEDQYRALMKALEAARLDGKALPFLLLGLRAEDGSLAAYVSLGLHHASAELEIYNIAVAEDKRQRGFGETLLKRALTEARRLGIRTALLEVRESNAAALALYDGAGFTRVGRRKGYYADTGEDALILSLSLTPSAPART